MPRIIGFAGGAALNQSVTGGGVTIVLDTGESESVGYEIAEYIDIPTAESESVGYGLINRLSYTGLLKARPAVLIESVLNVPNAEIWDNADRPWGQADAVYAEAKPVMLFGNRFFQADNGALDELENPVEVRLVRTGLTVSGRDRKGEWTHEPTIVKEITGIYPVIRGVAGSRIYIAVGSQMLAEESILWTPEKEFILGQDFFLDFIVAGRFLALSLRSLGQHPWELISYELEVPLIGSR
jgi:hypothetical protein